MEKSFNAGKTLLCLKVTGKWNVEGRVAMGKF